MGGGILTGGGTGGYGPEDGQPGGLANGRMKVEKDGGGWKNEGLESYRIAGRVDMMAERWRNGMRVTPTVLWFPPFSFSWDPH